MGAVVSDLIRTIPQMAGVICAIFLFFLAGFSPAIRCALAADAPALTNASSPCGTPHEQRFAVFCRLMKDPVCALPVIEQLEQAIRDHAVAPAAMLELLAGYQTGGAPLPPDSRAAAWEQSLLAAEDPLTHGLQLLGGRADSPDIPNLGALTRSQNQELGRLLLAIALAEQYRASAFAGLPAAMSPERLIAEPVGGGAALLDQADTVQHLFAVDYGALFAGMATLVAATERFRDQLLALPDWPAMEFRFDTPQGPIIVDLNSADNDRTLQRPLLLIDKGGNDRYRFIDSDTRAPISILIDLAGNDAYLSDGKATCPAAAVMGYGILWDEQGNDRYRGTQLAQGAALLGSALLFDGAGTDDFAADLQSQSFALFGSALLFKAGDGQDRYHALSQSQGSAGPGGVAALVDTGGDDQYRLGNEKVIVPSAQLPDRNASLGQGSAFGLRDRPAAPGALGGGIGILFDRAGNDIYRAQVFAQGSGYFHGLGMLLDDGGQDDYQAPWYAMGAAAHGAIGIFIDRGAGDDRHVATHSTSIGAAHDRSLAVFLDNAGNDDYAIGALGLGAAHMESVAHFIDLGGADRYRVAEPACRAFGVSVAHRNAPDHDGVYPGFFLDAGGDDSFPEQCASALAPRIGARQPPYRSLGE